MTVRGNHHKILCPGPDFQLVFLARRCTNEWLFLIRRHLISLLFFFVAIFFCASSTAPRQTEESCFLFSQKLHCIDTTLSLSFHLHTSAVATKTRQRRKTDLGLDDGSRCFEWPSEQRKALPTPSFSTKCYSLAATPKQGPMHQLEQHAATP